MLSIFERTAPSSKMFCEPKPGSRKCQNKSISKLKSLKCLLYVYKINTIHTALIEEKFPNARNGLSRCFNTEVWLIFLNIHSFLEENLLLLCIYIYLFYFLYLYLVLRTVLPKTRTAGDYQLLSIRNEWATGSRVSNILKQQKSAGHEL